MTTAPLDYKKKYRELYAPGMEPVLVDVPPISFIAVDGRGSPQDEEYQKAIEVLYALSYAIKISKMSADRPDGYFEYVVPPLEGLWSAGDNNA